MAEYRGMLETELNVPKTTSVGFAIFDIELG
jgi:hypothetical protein